MIRGRVIGEVWATKKLPDIKDRKILLVAELMHEESSEKDYKPSGRVVVAFDRLGAKIGHEVIVSFGSGGRNVFLGGKQNRNLLVDAAIAQIIDPEKQVISVVE
jgi:ethanolamine utilization protein EutN